MGVVPAYGCGSVGGQNHADSRMSRPASGSDALAIAPSDAHWDTRALRGHVRRGRMVASPPPHNAGSIVPYDGARPAYLPETGNGLFMPATARRRFVWGSLAMQSPSAAGSASPAVGPNAYREYLKAAGFSTDGLKTIHAFNDRRAVLDFLGALATTAAVPWLYWIYPHWITVIVCVLLSIHNFNALTQVGHASGHASFLSDTRWNAVAGEIAFALRGFSRAEFALSHQMHHAFLNEEDDGDILFGRPDDPKRKLLLMCLQDLLLMTALKRLLQYMQTDRKTYDQRPWEKLTVRFFVDRLGMMVPIAAAQALLLGYYWIIIGPQYYFFFYLLPLATLYPAQIRLRSACEHSFEAGSDVA